MSKVYVRPHTRVVRNWEDIRKEEWEEALREHLKRYYKGKKIKKIKIERNLLGEPIFKTIYFTDGTWVTFAKRPVLIKGKPSWYRHSYGKWK